MLVDKSCPEDCCAGEWKPGPMPVGTYNWGGVVPTSHKGSGFYFADFCGDHVKIVSHLGDAEGQVLQPHEVKFYNNSLGLPPGK